MLRRAAELTLERGYRYFILSQQQNLDQVDRWGQHPDREAIVRFTSERTPDSTDAVIVIRETDAEAGGVLSAAATEALRKYPPPAP